MKNYPLLRKTMEHIEAHRDEHDQSGWGRKEACGSTMCFAGHAVVLDGHNVIWTEIEDGHSVMSYVEMTDGSGDELSPMAAGARVLGLDLDESSHLFLACMKLSNVRLYVDHLLSEESRDGEVE